MNILFIGDIVGRAGRRSIRKLMDDIVKNQDIDFVLANGENAAGGFGLTEDTAEELYSYGIDCMTMGNHTWGNKNIYEFIDDNEKLIRPLNFNERVPGRGYNTYQIKDKNITVINLIGQVFMGNHNSPVEAFDRVYEKIKDKSDYIIVDFHGEATGEKRAFAEYVKGKVTLVVGTHTHVQTNDEQILDKGTGYITDLGFSGACDSILGMKKEKVLYRLKTKMPKRLEVATGQVQLSGIFATFNQKGETTAINSFIVRDNP
ncbi:MAG TPA: TIGR00282 family metallophosphoesterase [Halanaerobiales bacterium]|nr:TIGR00282 family metallophosphoesterase [Halanaerobiales bacterium]